MKTVSTAGTAALASLLLAVVACGGDNGGTGDDPGGDDDDTPVTEVTCDGATRYALPDDPKKTGPWPVGVKTMTIAGLTTEVWYPATRGSEAGKTKEAYDLRKWLPDADQTKIPDSENPLQVCECYRDLPLDDAHGPYPVIYFAHGTAAFRTQSAHQMAHWASRGFIVVAADHPKLYLKDALAFNLGGNQAGEVGMVLDGVLAGTGEAAFLAGHMDATKLALAGHSAGGGAIRGYASKAGVKVLIPMAAGAAPMGGNAWTLMMGGKDDTIAMWNNVKGGYDQATGRKWLVGLDKAGHLAFSDLCWIGRDQGGILDIAVKNGVEVNMLIQRLAKDGCEEGQLDPAKGWDIINYATSAVLEEALACGTGTSTLSMIQSVFPEVSDYAEAQ